MITERKALEMFDDFLDECYPMVNVCYEYSPSEVLKSVDPIAYRQEFLSWLDAEGYNETEDGYTKDEEETE